MLKSDNNREDLLAREASFQDQQIENTSRVEQEGFYATADFERARQKQIELIGDVSGKRVLEIGCGRGDGSIFCLRKGAHVTAIDISPESVRLVQKRVAEENSENRFEAIVMDAVHTSFDDNSFDVIIGSGILHHLVNFNGAIDEIMRITKPGGYSVFLEPLGINHLINLYRKFTPNARSVDEQPLTRDNLLTLRRKSPESELNFYCYFTLISKFLSVLRLRKLAQKLLPSLMRIDDRVLNRKKEPSYADRKSWNVVMKLKK